MPGTNVEYPIGIKSMGHVQFIAHKYTMPAVDQKTDITRSEQSAEGLFDIKMYIPKQLGDAIGATWGPEGITSTSRAINAAFNDDSPWTSDRIASISKEFLGTGLRDVFTMADQIAPGLSGWVQAQAAVHSGTIFRPNELNVLSGVGHNALSFEWTMEPRSKKEADEIKQIIRLFKDGSKPSLENTGDGISEFMKYPPMYTIRIWTLGATIGNPQSTKRKKEDLLSYQNMIITSFTITYGGGADELLFYNDGSPITATLALNFESLRPAYRVGSAAWETK